jgi:glycosyltransferase involved in cell wall biosynthesis
MLDVGSSASRKNVAGLVETLRGILSASTDVTIRLKVRDLSTDQAAAAAVQRLRETAPDRVELIQSDDSREAAITFFDGLDILVSLSRAEGFALPYAEAILRGVIVAAPRWSGPAEFLDDSNSIALPYRLVPINDPSGLYVTEMGAWADVDPAAAAQAVLERLNQRPTEAAPITVPTIASTAFFMDCLLGSELL